jgi:hypothetical protein
MSSRSQSFARTAATTPTPEEYTEECIPFVLEVILPWYTKGGTVLLQQFETAYKKYADAREDAALYEERGYRVSIRLAKETLYRSRLPTYSGPPPAGRSGLGVCLMEAYLATSNV